MIGAGVLALAAVGLLLYFVLIRPQSQKKPSGTPDASASQNESITIPSVSLTEADPNAQSTEETIPVSSESGQEETKQTQTV
ncbi:MAG: hypothetical protein J6Z38_04900, partial [Lachnospiraceae bacterium]|nr:hypothetical protein [Lachnospiraceae bacterium]